MYWTDKASEQTWRKQMTDGESVPLQPREACDWWLVAGKSDGSPSGFVWWSLSLKSLRQEAITSLSKAENDGLQTAQKAHPHTHTPPPTQHNIYFVLLKEWMSWGNKSLLKGVLVYKDKWCLWFYYRTLLSSSLYLLLICNGITNLIRYKALHHSRTCILTHTHTSVCVCVVINVVAIHLL